MPWDQRHYEGLRLELIDRNEARVDNVYLDTLGVPTVGFGVALTARQRDRSMRVDQEHVDALTDVLNLDAASRRQLGELLTDYSQVQNRHTDERFTNLGSFQRSEFGQEAQGVLGPMANTRHAGPNGVFYSWDVLADRQSPLQLSLTHEQSLQLFQRIAPDYENRLNGILRRVDCPAEALSEEQRAALYSMTYHGATGKAKRVAEPIGEYWRGEISEEQLQVQLRRASHDPNFPVRSANELELLQNIKRRPVRQTEVPVQQQEEASAAPPGPAGGARPEDDRRRPEGPERRRMIEGDWAGGNEIQFGEAPGIEPTAQGQRDNRAFATADPGLYPMAASQPGRKADEPDQTQSMPCAHALTPDQPQHPDHAMLEQIREHIRGLDQRAGRDYDEGSERFSRSLLASSKGARDMDAIQSGHSLASNALERVDHVVIGKDGRYAFAVQGDLDDPTHMRAHVDIVQARQTPVEQSDATLEVANQQIAQERQLAMQQELQQQQQQAAPVIRA
jgi:hypothetical protein